MDNRLTGWETVLSGGRHLGRESLEAHSRGLPLGHSYEEIRAVTLDLLAGRETGTYEASQYQNLLVGVSEVLERREGPQNQRGFGGTTRIIGSGGVQLSQSDRNIFLEVFWSLFRDGIITLGLDDSNREFPFFRVTEFGKKMLDHQQAYFFHDVSSFETTLRQEVPKVDDTTVIYLKEAMQAFRSGCLLSATVMLGVATEHTFLLLVEDIEQSTSAATFKAVSEQRTILQKVNKFKNILDQKTKSLPGDVKEDLDTHFAGVLSIIRNFRNQSGHPTGKIIDREQTYVLLQLFIPYCKKMYQLRHHFK